MQTLEQLRGQDVNCVNELIFPDFSGKVPQGNEEARGAGAKSRRASSEGKL